MRLFVALDLAIPVVENLVLLQEDLHEPLEALGLTPRWTDAANIHLTLRFLGAVDDALVHRIRDKLREACDESPLFDLRTRGTGAFPGTDCPRILWAGVGEGGDALEALRARVEAGLDDLGLEGDPRPFHPHITLGRMRTEGNRADVGAALAPYSETEFGVTQVKDIALMQSQLHPKGAIYKVVERFALRG